MKPLFITLAIAASALSTTYSDFVLSSEPQEVVWNFPGTPADTTLIVGRNSTFWDLQWATGFKTGNERTKLSSALFLYDGAWPGTTGGFNFALHADNNGLPGTQSALLEGPDRPVNGYSWYDAPDDTILEANTAYWLVASAPQTESPRFFYWRGTTSDDETSNLPGWEILNDGALRTNEGEWELKYNMGHTSIKVEAIPEPMTAAFLAAAAGLFVVRRNLCSSTEKGSRRLYLQLNRLFSNLYLQNTNGMGPADRWTR